MVEEALPIFAERSIFLRVVLMVAMGGEEVMFI
jgi:hypothetical protein